MRNRDVHVLKKQQLDTRAIYTNENTTYVRRVLYEHTRINCTIRSTYVFSVEQHEPLFLFKLRLIEVSLFMTHLYECVASYVRRV